jgi:AraC-like DNA-binding protein
MDSWLRRPAYQAAAHSGTVFATAPTEACARVIVAKRPSDPCGPWRVTLACAGPREQGCVDSENALSQSSSAAARHAGSVATGAVTGRIAPVYLIPLLAAAGRAGIAGDALFHGLGLVADDLDVPGFTVSPNEANTVVRRALQLLASPDLGLSLGMHTRITERGALALGLMAAATLGDAIDLTLQFPGSAGDLMAVHAERGRQLALLVAEPMFGNEDIAPFLVDIMFAGAVRMRRQVTQVSQLTRTRHGTPDQAPYTPAYVELVRARPSHAAAYESYFACPVRFGRKRNVLATALPGLAQPLPMANKMAYRLSLHLLASEPGQAGSASALGLAVARAIRRALPLAVAPAEVASSLHLSERSLRRRLAQEGLSFRGLLDEARKVLALKLMDGDRRRVTEIAMQTGFSDVRAFSRAFKRWTGKPPSALLDAVHRGVAEPGDGDGGHWHPGDP